MATNKGLLFGAALANGVNAFLDAREKGDLQRQRQALATVEQQMKLRQLDQADRRMDLAESGQKLSQELALQRLASADLREQELTKRRGYAAGGQALTNIGKSFGGVVGDAIEGLTDIFKPDATSYKINKDLQEAKAKEEAIKRLREMYKDDPDMLAQLEASLNRMQAGLPVSIQRQMLSDQSDSLMLDRLTSGMSTEQKDKILDRYYLGELKIDPENIPGTREALMAGERLKSLQNANKLDAARLEQEKYLSVSEAEALGVKYGITRKQAWSMGKEPGRFKLEEDKDGSLIRIDNWATDPKDIRTVVFQKEAGMTTEALNFYYQRSKDFQSLEISKDYYVMKKQAGRLVETVAQIPRERAAGRLGSLVGVDQALIMIYNKLSDETSVVRESEYARTGKNLPVINQLTGYFGAKLEKGGAGLNDVERLALARMGMLYAEQAEMAWMGAAAEQARKAESLGLKIQPLVGYGFVNVKGERVDTSSWDADRWEAEADSRRDAPPLKIDEMVGVIAGDFDLGDAEMKELSQIFTQSGLGLSADTLQAIGGD